MRFIIKIRNIFINYLNLFRPGSKSCFQRFDPFPVIFKEIYFLDFFDDC